MKKIIILAAVAALSSCATKASNIAAAYVSPTLYQKLSCKELADEATAVSSHAIAASGAQDKKAGQDAAVTTVGVVLFWPALFFTSGDGASAAEVARLKGEMQAIEDASRVNKCGIKFQKA
ncbi:hypothetical protein [Rhizobium sp. HT1-10]|uniref:hypothetical protein n=1 Tax=Rhizobium sp. HT1-10 TaxID=3111638 RepID=UPI003C218468